VKGKKFATALNCMDGRVQEPVIKFLKEKYKVDFVDMITEPGIDRILAEGDKKILEEIKNKIEISIKKHGSKVVAIVGHTDCAGNPVGKRKHLRQIRKGKEILKSMNIEVEILGLWVNEKWEVEVVE
jgi:carbonic anhydrase